MRWLRENWIDALIFAVFAVTVVGIVLFLTGVNPFKAKSPSSVTTPVSVEAPAASETPTAGETAQPQAGANTEEPVTVVPLLPKPPEAAAAQVPEATTPQPTQPEASSPASAPTAARPAANPQTAATPTAPAGPETGIFRVSVGAFGNPLNALSLAQTLEREGYAVRLEPVGRVTRVAVGPFTRRSDAVQAAKQLAKYEPQIYRGDTPTPSGIYLQVGAFKQLASAEATLRTLREQGIGPVVLWYQKPWIKVWVGPVEPDGVSALKQKLIGAGFEVVEVR